MLYRLSYVSGRSASGDTGHLNNQTQSTAYRDIKAELERVAGIEPASSAWKAEVLPLNYTRQIRFAPSLHLRICPSYARPVRGGGGRIRTYEGVSRQIYSLLPLAAWVPLRAKTSRVF